MPFIVFCILSTAVGPVHKLPYARGSNTHDKENLAPNVGPMAGG